MKLTQKQETFCINYFESGNATEAALVAGYSKKTATVIASINLTKVNIINRLQELRDAAASDKIMGVVERKERLSEIARAVIPDFIEEGFIKVEKESPNVGAVSEVTTVTKVFRKGDSPVNITNLKLHSPLQAIAELNKMEKIYSEETTVNIDNRKVEVIVNSEQARQLTDKIIHGEGTD